MSGIRKLLTFRTAALLASAALIWVVASAVSGREPNPQDLRMYDYRDTRRLVALTARAAALIAREGEKAFAEFSENPKRWSVDGHSYLYVYTLDATNLYHGGYPELTGRNLMDFSDPLGKKVSRIIIDQLQRRREANPHGWVHYLWTPPDALDGAWKASCNFPVTLPDGRKAYVGSGLDAPPQEKEFYRIIVDEAAELLSEKGKAALALLKDPEGPFSIYDRDVFVIENNGKALIDPGLPLELPRDLFQYRDPSGRQPLLELSRRLEEADSAWVVFLARDKSEAKPAKKGIYGRRAELDGRKVLLGAICPLPRPAWMP